jgi:hypothetical protein
MEQGSPVVSIEIDNEPKSVIIDTGSSVSILQPGASGSDLQVTAVDPYGVTGEDLDVRGKQFVTFLLVGKTFKHTFLVCPLPTESDGILGSDFLDKAGAVINLYVKRLSPSSNVGTRDPYVAKCAQHTALTVFPKEGGRSKEPPGQKEERKNLAIMALTALLDIGRHQDAGRGW